MRVRVLELLDHALDGDRLLVVEHRRRMMRQAGHGRDGRERPAPGPRSLNARIMACLSARAALQRLLSNVKSSELRAAVFRLHDGVVLVLAAVPVADAQALVRIAQLHVRLLHVPRLGQRRRIVDPDIRDQRLVVGLPPDLDGLDLIGVIGMLALIDTGLQLIRVNHQLRPSQKPIESPLWNRIAILRGDVVAAIGVDAPDVVHHLVDQPRLIRRDDELAEERFGQPARMPGRCAGGNRIPLDALLHVLDALRPSSPDTPVSASRSGPRLAADRDRRQSRRSPAANTRRSSRAAATTAAAVRCWPPCAAPDTAPARSCAGGPARCSVPSVRSGRTAVSGAGVDASGASAVLQAASGIARVRSTPAATAPLVRDI